MRMIISQLHQSASDRVFMLHDVATSSVSAISRWPFVYGARGAEVAKQLVICIGSSHRARTVKNPFSFAERKQLILDNVPEMAERIHIVD